MRIRKILILVWLFVYYWRTPPQQTMGFLKYIGDKLLLSQLEEFHKLLELEKSQRIGDFAKLHDLVQSSLMTLASRDRMRNLREKRQAEEEAPEQGYKVGQSVAFNGNNTV